MGIKRFARRLLVPGQWHADAMKNVQKSIEKKEKELRQNLSTLSSDENCAVVIGMSSYIEGYLQTIKEDWTEDNPITAPIYQYGKFDGKKEGYNEASFYYESQLLELADKFLSQQKSYQEEHELYEVLLDDYETEIELLSQKLNRTTIENDYLQQLLYREKELRKLAK